MRSRWLCLWCAISATPAVAGETITHSYDVQGRVVKVQHAGTVNNNQQAQYAYDKAGNRISVIVTGSTWGNFTWGKAGWSGR